MSNGRFMLAEIAERPSEKEIPKTKKSKQKAIKVASSRFDLVSDAAYHFFLVPFALFVAFLAFFPGGLAAAFRKGLEVLEERYSYD